MGRRQNTPQDRKYHAAYREKKREKLRGYARSYRSRHRDKIREIAKRCYDKRMATDTSRSLYNLKRRLWKYGLTLEQFRQMEERQQHLCRICREKRPLVIDHDHDTLRVRGLICDGCNKGLGFLDSVQLLESATRYLVESQE